MASFGAMMRLQVIFPDADDDLLESTLIKFKDNVDMSIRYLTEEKRLVMSDAAKEALKPKQNVATKETITNSTGMLRLQKVYPDMDVDVLNATLKAFGNDPDKAIDYLKKNNSDMHLNKMVRNKSNPDKPTTSSSSSSKKPPPLPAKPSGKK